MFPSDAQKLLVKAFVWQRLRVIAPNHACLAFLAVSLGVAGPANDSRRLLSLIAALKLKSETPGQLDA